MSDEIDPNFFSEVAQNAHMLAGSTVAFCTLALYPLALWYVIAAFAAVTAVKEFWYDQKYENAATRGSNLNDWVHYQIGWILAVGINYACVVWIFKA